MTRLNEQTREIREMLQAAAARPMPVENIERQIADLGRRVDLIAQRGSTKLGGDAVAESVQAIRQTVENALPASLLHTLNSVSKVSAARSTKPCSRSCRPSRRARSKT